MEETETLRQAIAGLIESNDILQEEVTRLRVTSSTLRRVNSALRDSIKSLRRQVEFAQENDDMFKRFCNGEFDANVGTVSGDGLSEDASPVEPTV